MYQDAIRGTDIPGTLGRLVGKGSVDFGKVEVHW